MVLIQLTGTPSRGSSQQHSQATIIGDSNLIEAARGEEAIIEVKVVIALTKRDILTILREILTIFRGQQIIQALAGAQMVVLASQGHRWVCRKDFSVLPDEASTLTLKTEAYSGPGM